MAVLDDEIRVYWMSGCSNCVRLKEYVTRKGFDFVAINMQEDPVSVAALETRGIRGAPVITRGEKWAFGHDLAAVDEVLGIGDVEHDCLPADVLVDHAIRITAAAVRFARQLPEARYWDNVPGRERSYLVLANHVVGHLSRFVAVAEDPQRCWDHLSYAAAGWQVPRPGEDSARFNGRSKDYTDDVLTVDVIAEKAADLTERAEKWLASDTDLDQVVHVYYGAQTVYQVLRSQTYSIAQHTRQLQAVVAYLGYKPDGPLAADDLQNLELPAALWDEI